MNEKQKETKRNITNIYLFTAILTQIIKRSYMKTTMFCSFIHSFTSGRKEMDMEFVVAAASDSPIDILLISTTISTTTI